MNKDSGSGAELSMRSLMSGRRQDPPTDRAAGAALSVPQVAFGTSSTMLPMTACRVHPACRARVEAESGLGSCVFDQSRPKTRASAARGDAQFSCYEYLLGLRLRRLLLRLPVLPDPPDVSALLASSGQSCPEKTRNA